MAGTAGVLVCPRHKSGDVHRTAVGEEVREAAKRLRARGWPADSEFSFNDAIREACVAAEIPPFSPGAFRHSVPTWAIEVGADPAAVAAFLGDRSPATTRKRQRTRRRRRYPRWPEDPFGPSWTAVAAPNKLSVWRRAYQRW